MTAGYTELIPHLPYLLQDLWELGSSPKDIIDMFQKHIKVSETTKVLDLACGKGAVSIQVAKALDCKIKGIDIIPEFVDFANKKAKEYGVENLCEFKAGDINKAVKIEKDYDIVILGAVGDVLGNPEETIQLLKNTVKNGGYIFINDAYGNNDSDERYPTREKWFLFFQKAGVKLLDEIFNEEADLESLNNEQQSFIVMRANEIKEKYPDKAYLFESYIQSQQAECDELENEISGVTMLLQVI
ncbi:class I SAM-dependent methyltransferase [Anaerobacterium chartisolvens]|uniref:class I SAM-dependent methyltransferase n=1 Tax=Anaerobacterium chartisolvens TaxID=1297424 RepID=UPI001FA915B5|nr:methyltransferase domain-containing protein [Anaerobacterium chartisolvens]